MKLVEFVGGKGNAILVNPDAFVRAQECTEFEDGTPACVLYLAGLTTIVVRVDLEHVKGILQDCDLQRKAA